MATETQGGAGRPDGARKRYQGKLELTWTNKDQSLLAHEGGSYEWLPPSDYRVAEARLSRDAAVVGDVKADLARARDNLLTRYPRGTPANRPGVPTPTTRRLRRQCSRTSAMT